MQLDSYKMLMQSHGKRIRFFYPIRESWRLLLDADVIPDSSTVSKRFSVTVPDSVFDELEAWAEYQGRPTANLAAYLIEAGIRQAKLEGEFRSLEKESSPKENESTLQNKQTPSPRKSKGSK